MRQPLCTLIPHRLGALSALVPRGSEARSLPARVTELIHDHDDRSERLIGWAQLGLVVILSALYFIAPRPADAPPRMLAEPVPIALAAYFVFTALRLFLAYRGRLPGWILLLSIIIDIGLLL